jgi:hypothetical protein
MQQELRIEILSRDFFDIDPTYVSRRVTKYSFTSASENLFGNFSERIFTRDFFGDFSNEPRKNASQSFTHIDAIGEKDGRSTFPFPISTQASSAESINARGPDIPKCVIISAPLSPSICASSKEMPESSWSHFSSVTKDEREGQRSVIVWPRLRAKL